MITQTFLDRGLAEEVIALTEADRNLKRRMFDCFSTQQRVLSSFGVEYERLRDAPTYDFKEAPHPGPLLYELWGWGISGYQWRREATATCLARAVRDKSIKGT